MDPVPGPLPASPVQVPPKSALAFFGVLVLLRLPSLVAQAAQPVAGLAWTEIFTFLLPALVAVAGSNLRARPYLRLGPVSPSVAVLGALVGAAGYLFAGAVMAATELLLPRSWVHAFDLQRLFEGPSWARLGLAGLAALLAPPCEEIAFRGYVQTTLVLRRGVARAIAVTAVLFAILHLDPVRFPALVVLGATFGWLAWRAGSIWPAVAAHAMNNGIAAGLVLAGAKPPPGPPRWVDVAAPLAIGATALGFLLAGYRSATPHPPPASEAVVLRDPSLPALRFSGQRVPPPLAVAAAVGIALLAGLVVIALVRAAARP